MGVLQYKWGFYSCLSANIGGNHLQISEVKLVSVN